MYLALVAEQPVSGPGDPTWRSCYEYFPWEDLRGGRPAMIDEEIAPLLGKWAGAAGEADEPARRGRGQVVFALGGAPFDPNRPLSRDELLYEAGLLPDGDGSGVFGRPMRLDHRRIAATALERVRELSTARSSSSCSRSISPCSSCSGPWRRSSESVSNRSNSPPRRAGPARPGHRLAQEQTQTARRRAARSASLESRDAGTRVIRQPVAVAEEGHGAIRSELLDEWRAARLWVEVPGLASSSAREQAGPASPSPMGW